MGSNPTLSVILLIPSTNSRPVEWQVNQMPILRMISGPYTGQQFLLTEGTAEIGRDPACAIPLPQDNGISRCHARLELASGRLMLHDLGSSNGLFVNDSRTASTLLQLGDRLQVGNSVMVIDPDPVEVPAPHSAATASPGDVLSGSAPSVSYGGVGGGSPATSGQPQVPGSAAGFAPAMPGGSSAYRGSGVANAWWLYFLAFSFPPIGLIFGVMYLRKDMPDEKRAGWWILIWSLIGGILGWMSYVEIMKFMPLVQSMLSGGGALKGLMGGDGS
ncbi:MAG: FHA domain-containing protein [Armatimonadota bacterium]|nr:FHA domain-containing protein [Armatimonadota bacterium]